MDERLEHEQAAEYNSKKVQDGQASLVSMETKSQPEAAGSCQYTQGFVFIAFKLVLISLI